MMVPCGSSQLVGILRARAIPWTVDCRFSTSKFYRTQHHLNLNVRSFRTTTQNRAGYFANIRTAFRNVYYGDDHINPKKILERKYLYLALTAIHWRTLRLAAGPDGANERTLREQTLQELEDGNPDNLTNVELRILLHEYLHPQVNAIFESFSRVDESLGIPLAADDEDLDFCDTSEYKHTLLNEYDRTRQQILEATGKDNASERTLAFFQRKCDAIETLLTHHKWSEGEGKSGTERTGGSVDAFGIDVSNLSDNNLRIIRKYQTMNICRSAKIRDELGFSVLCLQSNVSGAGRGLFVDGQALAGSVIAFQPGDIWPKEHLLTDCKLACC